MPRIAICRVGLLVVVTTMTAFAQAPRPAAQRPQSSAQELALDRKELRLDRHAARPIGPPRPGDMIVNCGLPGAPISSISAALARLDPTRVNTVRVSGSCNENVIVQSFANLTLIANPGASINDTSGGSLDVLDVADTHEFSLQGFTVNGGLVGVACFDFSRCRFSGNTIQGAVGDGVAIEMAQANLQNDTLQNNAGRGLAVRNGGLALAIGVTAQGNGVGAVANTGSHLTVLNLISQNNGGNGIRVVNHSTLWLIDTAVTGNGFQGVFIDSSSEAFFDMDTTGNVITSNGLAGVRLGDLSFARFDGSHNITGNNLDNPGGLDVACIPQFSATRGALTNIGGGTTNCLEP